MDAILYRIIPIRNQCFTEEKRSVVGELDLLASFTFPRALCQQQAVTGPRQGLVFFRGNAPSPLRRPAPVAIPPPVLLQGRQIRYRFGSPPGTEKVSGENGTSLRDRRGTDPCDPPSVRPCLKWHRRYSGIRWTGSL